MVDAESKLCFSQKLDNLRCLIVGPGVICGPFMDGADRKGRGVSVPNQRRSTKNLLR